MNLAVKYTYTHTDGKKVSQNIFNFEFTLCNILCAAYTHILNQRNSLIAECIVFVLLFYLS